MTTVDRTKTTTTNLLTRNEVSMYMHTGKAPKGTDHLTLRLDVRRLHD